MWVSRKFRLKAASELLAVITNTALLGASLNLRLISSGRPSLPTGTALVPEAFRRSMANCHIRPLFNNSICVPMYVCESSVKSAPSDKCSFSVSHMMEEDSKTGGAHTMNPIAPPIVTIKVSSGIHQYLRRKTKNLFLSLDEPPAP